MNVVVAPTQAFKDNLAKIDERSAEISPRDQAAAPRLNLWHLINAYPQDASLREDPMLALLIARKTFACLISLDTFHPQRDKISFFAPAVSIALAKSPHLADPQIQFELGKIYSLVKYVHLKSTTQFREKTCQDPGEFYAGAFSVPDEALQVGRASHAHHAPYLTLAAELLHEAAQRGAVCLKGRFYAHYAARLGEKLDAALLEYLKSLPEAQRRILLETMLERQLTSQIRQRVLRDNVPLLVGVFTSPARDAVFSERGLEMSLRKALIS